MNLALVLGGFVGTIALGLVVIAALKRSERNREAFENAHLTEAEKWEHNPGLKACKMGLHVEGSPEQVAQKIAKGIWQ